jgi:hypothetical protein
MSSLGENLTFSPPCHRNLSILIFARSQSDTIRPTLLTLYRTACLHHDEMSQAVLINLLLRNYLDSNLIQQANTLASKTTFPESASNNQFCRFLYYMGRIQVHSLLLSLLAVMTRAGCAIGVLGRIPETHDGCEEDPSRHCQRVRPHRAQAVYHRAAADGRDP